MKEELQPWEKFTPGQLIDFVNDRIQHDFAGLVNLLYRLDINETRLKKLLTEHPDEDAGKIIAALIIERHQQKCRSRESFKQQGDIPEEEKW
ncbi:MAG: hypothetical protein NVSMB63_00390 [Sediminibacterium sp.]